MHRVGRPYARGGEKPSLMSLVLDDDVGGALLLFGDKRAAEYHAVLRAVLFEFGLELEWASWKVRSGVLITFKGTALAADSDPLNEANLEEGEGGSSKISPRNKRLRDYSTDTIKTGEGRGEGDQAKHHR